MMSFDNKRVSAGIVFFTSALLFCGQGGLCFGSQLAQTHSEDRSPVLRGEGQNLELLLTGRVLDKNSQPAKPVSLTVVQKTKQGLLELPVTLEGHRFETWIPIGRQGWFYLQLLATDEDGSTASAGVGLPDLRQASIDGIDLRFKAEHRSFRVKVQHQGQAVPDASVRVEAGGVLKLEGQTDQNGTVDFQIPTDLKIRSLFAQTKDMIGKRWLFRSSATEQAASEFEVDVVPCEPLTVRFIDADSGKAIPGVSFSPHDRSRDRKQLGILGSFDLQPQVFQANKLGEAVIQKFPEPDLRRVTVSIADPLWMEAETDWQKRYQDIPESRVVEVPVIRRPQRKTLTGQVTCDIAKPAAVLIRMYTVQSENKLSTETLFAFTDSEGRFSIDCLPDSTYCLCVNDSVLASKTINFIPYDSKSETMVSPKLQAKPGEQVEIRLTQGSGYEPIANSFVNLRTNERFSWFDGERVRYSTDGRSWGVMTDAEGVATAWAPAGAKLSVSVVTEGWASGKREVTVLNDDVTKLAIHREVAEPRLVSGRLIGVEGQPTNVAGAEVVLGSTGGRTDELQRAKTNEKGEFFFQSQAARAGLFASTADGKAAGILQPEDLNSVLEIPLQPTTDLEGQLLDQEGKPFSGAQMRAKVFIDAPYDSNMTWVPAFTAKTFETTTSADGTYLFRNLPTGTVLLLSAEVDGKRVTMSPFKVSLKPGEGSVLVSRVGRPPRAHVPMGQLMQSRLTDATQGKYRILTIIAPSDLSETINRTITDVLKLKEINHYLTVRLTEASCQHADVQEYLAKRDWPAASSPNAFLAAIDSSGNELARTTINLEEDSAGELISEFVRNHAGPPIDAEADWQAALKEAAASDRRVWAIASQRTCGPCFLLARWMHRHADVLQKDYVFLKVDTIRDHNGLSVADRIAGGRENYGISFHSIFDSEGRRLADSEGPSGNIGCGTSSGGPEHMAKMLRSTSQRLTDTEIETLVETLK